MTDLDEVFDNRFVPQRGFPPDWQSLLYQFREWSGQKWHETGRQYSALARTAVHHGIWDTPIVQDLPSMGAQKFTKAEREEWRGQHYPAPPPPRPEPEAYWYMYQTQALGGS
jgi:hypothetical protein